MSFTKDQCLYLAELAEEQRGEGFKEGERGKEHSETAEQR